jgi:hypothetical protein
MSLMVRDNRVERLLLRVQVLASLGGLAALVAFVYAALGGHGIRLQDMVCSGIVIACSGRVLYELERFRG